MPRKTRTEHETEHEADADTAVTQASASASEIGSILRQYPQRFQAAVPIGELEPWPGNPKDHDIGAIVESMRENGVISVLYAQASTGRVMAGHGRIEALAQLGVATMDTIFVDCPNAVAKRFVLADNRLTQLGGYNDATLYDFLRGMSDAGESLAGTGYTADDIDSLHFLVEGTSFSPAQDRTDEEDHEYASHTIVVRVLSVPHTQAATAAVALLLTEHPEWKAHVAAK